MVQCIICFLPVYVITVMERSDVITVMQVMERSGVITVMQVMERSDVITVMQVMERSDVITVMQAMERSYVITVMQVMERSYVITVMQVMERSDLNKMTAGNLAVVFGPNLCRPAVGGPQQISLASMQAVNTFVECLLSHHTAVVAK